VKSAAKNAERFDNAFSRQALHGLRGGLARRGLGVGGQSRLNQAPLIRVHPWRLTGGVSWERDAA